MDMSRETTNLRTNAHIELNAIHVARIRLKVKNDTADFIGTFGPFCGRFPSYRKQLCQRSRDRGHLPLSIEL